MPAYAPHNRFSRSRRQRVRGPKYPREKAHRARRLLDERRADTPAGLSILSFMVYEDSLRTACIGTTDATAGCGNEKCRAAVLNRALFRALQKGASRQEAAGNSGGIAGGLDVLFAEHGAVPKPSERISGSPGVYGGVSFWIATGPEAGSEHKPCNSGKGALSSPSRHAENPRNVCILSRSPFGSYE